ncbi:MAG: ExbD/TolR family protein [Phycisphaerae bacterium]
MSNRCGRDRRRKRRRGGDSLIVPVASMGDIAFLLIIFFVICFNPLREANLKLEKPESIDFVQLEQRAITVTIDQDGDLYLKGVKVDPDLLEDTIKQELAVLGDQPGADTVLLKCDKTIDQEVYLPVIESIGNAGCSVAVWGKEVGR